MDSITYDDLPVDLKSHQGVGVWFDKPCVDEEHHLPCTYKIVVDLVDAPGTVKMEHPIAKTLVPFKLPSLVVHTCDVKWADSDDPQMYSVDGEWSSCPGAGSGSGCSLPLDNPDHNDFKRNAIDTFYNLLPGETSFTITAKSSDVRPPARAPAHPRTRAQIPCPPSVMPHRTPHVDAHTPHAPRPAPRARRGGASTRSTTSGRCTTSS